MRWYLLIIALLPLRLFASTSAYCEVHQGVAPLSNPVLFAAVVPIPDDFATIGSTFANHLAGLREVGRGGDLMIRYPDGNVCNLTREGGFGSEGMQGASSIAVRDPAVHFSGSKALFSMIVGGAGSQYQVNEYYWQIYEVTGLGQGEPVTVTRIAHQPTSYNNIGPVYGSDGRIIFSSDRPRSGERHLWPQHDEYESSPTPTGLWSIDPDRGGLKLLQHSPSGSFDPIVDTYGRIVFSRWDHLQRDQQAAADEGGGYNYGTFDFADESLNAERTTNRVEVFPEPLPSAVPSGSNLEGNRINHFFPWELNQDGTHEETLNHIGRHELHSYFNRALNDDANVVEFIDVVSGRENSNDIFNFFQPSEDPAAPGRYVFVDAPEFNTHASGQLFVMRAQPQLNPDDMTVEYLTHPETNTTTTSPSANHSGHYRDPLPLADGRLAASHTFETRDAGNEGSRAQPDPRYDFRLRVLSLAGNGYLSAQPGNASALTSGISRTVSYYDPDVLVTYTGNLWELHAVEVRSRPVPPLTSVGAPQAPESQALAAAGVEYDDLRDFMVANQLAMIVARDVTSRDDLDLQQPFNLRVPGGIESVSSGGKVYDINQFQFFQGDQVRGIGGAENPTAGRRVLSRALHDARAMRFNLPEPPGLPGGASIAVDGSVAMFVPARRALAWQSNSPTGEPVVRERFWVTFQPGEIRVCDGCHGVNKVNQMGAEAATNTPQAMIDLLNHWRTQLVLFEDAFED